MSQTDRLILTPLDPSDAETVAAMFALQSDPDTWRHLPDAVETDISQSQSAAEEYARSWLNYGLGWWGVRARHAFGSVCAGEFIGIGGAAVRRPHIAAWNVGYRLRPEAWGRGLAAELSHEALVLAGSARPDLPVTARALSRNPASWRTLEKVGLSLVWEGDADADYPLTSGLLRRVYSDRPLAPALLQQVIALG